MNHSYERAVLQSSAFLSDLAVAHIQDARDAEAMRLQAQNSFDAWATHVTEYLRVRYGIVLGRFHYVPSIERVVFIPKLAQRLDALTGGYLPNPLRYRLLRILDGYLDVVAWPDGPDLLLEATKENLQALEGATKSGAWTDAMALKTGKAVPS